MSSLATKSEQELFDETIDSSNDTAVVSDSDSLHKPSKANSTLIRFVFDLLYADILVWVSLSLGSGPRPKPKTKRDPDSEFNSIHFGIEIKKKRVYR